MGTNEPANPFTTETQSHRNSKKTNDARLKASTTKDTKVHEGKKTVFELPS